MEISIIAAMGTNREIGSKNTIPWHLRSDLARFKQLTLDHAVIMGRKTFESIGKPLPKRDNIVISRNPEFTRPDIKTASSLQHALELVTDQNSEVFVIGGAEIYAAALPNAIRMYLTMVNYSGPADAFFPPFSDNDWRLIDFKIPTKTVDDDHEFHYQTLTPNLSADNMQK